MKKTLLFTICLSCISSLFAKPFNPQSPAAVVSVIANNEINWEGEAAKSGGLLGSMAKKDSLDNDDEESLLLKGFTTPLMKDAVAAVYEVFAEEGIELIDEASVIGSNAYANAEDNKMYKMAMNITADGYKLIGLKDSSIKDISAEVGAASIIIVNFKIEKMIAKGVGKNGTMTACVTAIIDFCDTNGKSLKNVNGFAKGTETIDVKMDKYDALGLAAMYPAVFRDALKTAIAKIKK